jgi:predicted nucleic acid-binding protein
MTAFVDTYALIAWLNPRDDAHPVVREYLESYSGRLVTSEWVLMEVADALAAPHARLTVIEFLLSVRADPNYEIVPCEHEVYQPGFEWFSTHRDKKWSLTDCISFAIMRERELTDALTADHHFSQAGFNAVFEAK